MIQFNRLRKIEIVYEERNLQVSIFGEAYKKLYWERMSRKDQVRMLASLKSTYNYFLKYLNEE